MPAAAAAASHPPSPSGVSSHYASVASSYSTAFFYDVGSPIFNWQTSEIAAALGGAAGCGSGTRIADIGGGTGEFTQALARELKLDEPPLNVEPSAEMLAKTPKGVVPVHLGAEEFARQRDAYRYDVALLKEMVHHLSNDALLETLKGLHAQISPGGRLLIVTRPHEPGYPFFKAAQDVWRKQQPSGDTYAEMLRTAGFDSVTVSTHAYPCSVPAGRWFDMVRTRFWSTFHAMTDADIEAGLDELVLAYQLPSKSDASGLARSHLSFDDRLVFVSGAKGARAPR